MTILLLAFHVYCLYFKLALTCLPQIKTYCLHPTGLAGDPHFLPATPTTHLRPVELLSEEQIAEMSYEELLKFAGGYEKDILDIVD